MMSIEQRHVSSPAESGRLAAEHVLPRFMDARKRSRAEFEGKHVEYVSSSHYLSCAEHMFMIELGVGNRLSTLRGMIATPKMQGEFERPDIGLVYAYPEYGLYYNARLEVQEKYEEYKEKDAAFAGKENSAGEIDLTVTVTEKDLCACFLDCVDTARKMWFYGCVFLFKYTGSIPRASLLAARPVHMLFDDDENYLYNSSKDSVYQLEKDLANCIRLRAKVQTKLDALKESEDELREKLSAEMSRIQARIDGRKTQMEDEMKLLARFRAAKEARDLMYRWKEYKGRVRAGVMTDKETELRRKALIREGVPNPDARIPDEDEITSHRVAKRFARSLEEEKEELEELDRQCFPREESKPALGSLLAGLETDDEEDGATEATEKIASQETVTFPEVIELD